MNLLTLIASHSNDKLFDKNGKHLSTSKGGPAFFIGSVLKKERINFKKLINNSIEIDVLKDKKGELYRCSNPPLPIYIDCSNIKSLYLVVSPIFDEFRLHSPSLFRGKIFLDVQGYVRNARYFGRKKNWKPGEELADSIFCLKVSLEELKYISKNIIKKQKNKILILTKGKGGIELFAFGKKYTIKAPKIVKTKNTIGAGDTFFAYFISGLIKSYDLKKASFYASLKTAEFLTMK